MVSVVPVNRSHGVSFSPAGIGHDPRRHGSNHGAGVPSVTQDCGKQEASNWGTRAQTSSMSCVGCFQKKASKLSRDSHDDCSTKGF